MTLIATTETVVPDEGLLEVTLCNRALHQLARHALDPADLRELGLALGLLTSADPADPKAGVGPGEPFTERVDSDLRFN